MTQSTNVTLERRAFSVGEVSAMVGLHETTIRGLIRTGRIRAGKAGPRRYLIPREELDRITGRAGREQDS